MVPFSIEESERSACIYLNYYMISIHFPPAPVSSMSPEFLYSVDSICNRGGGFIKLLYSHLMQFLTCLQAYFLQKEHKPVRQCKSIKVLQALTWKKITCW